MVGRSIHAWGFPPQARDAHDPQRPSRAAKRAQQRRRRQTLREYGRAALLFVWVGVSSRALPLQASRCSRRRPTARSCTSSWAACSKSSAPRKTCGQAAVLARGARVSPVWPTPFLVWFFLLASTSASLARCARSACCPAKKPPLSTSPRASRVLRRLPAVGSYVPCCFASPACRRPAAEAAAKAAFNTLAINGRRLRIMWGRSQGAGRASNADLADAAMGGADDDAAPRPAAAAAASAVAPVRDSRSMGGLLFFSFSIFCSNSLLRYAAAWVWRRERHDVAAAGLWRRGDGAAGLWHAAAAAAARRGTGRHPVPVDGHAANGLAQKHRRGPGGRRASAQGVKSLLWLVSLF